MVARATVWGMWWTCMNALEALRIAIKVVVVFVHVLW